MKGHGKEYLSPKKASPCILQGSRNKSSKLGRFVKISKARNKGQGQGQGQGHIYSSMGVGSTIGNKYERGRSGRGSPNCVHNGHSE